MRKYSIMVAFAAVFAVSVLAAQEPEQTASVPEAEVIGSATYAEQSTAPEGQHAAGTVTKSSVVTRLNLQLSDRILHTTVMDYSQPAELAAVAEKCAAGEPDECYFSYKAFENSEDPAVAARANLELSILSLQRGLVKQALAYIDKAASLAPEDPFVELTRGWTLFAAGKYKKARQSFANMLYLTADFEYASSAKLGTALAYYFEGEDELAASDFQYIYTSNPYLISFSAYMMGRIASER